GGVGRGAPGVEVLAAGHRLAEPVQARQPIALFAAAAGRVDEPYREFSVGVEIHSRSLAAGRLVGQGTSITPYAGRAPDSTPSRCGRLLSLRATPVPITDDELRGYPCLMILYLACTLVAKSASPHR